MEAGKLPYQVEIQRDITQVVAPSQDSFGEPVEPVWVTFATRWAGIKHLSGRELETARQEVATATHRFTMRGTGLTRGENEAITAVTILPTDRLFVGGRVFEIGSLDNVDFRDEQLDLLVTERL